MPERNDDPVAEVDTASSGRELGRRRALSGIVTVGVGSLISGCASRESTDEDTTPNQDEPKPRGDDPSSDPTNGNASEPENGDTSDPADGEENGDTSEPENDDASLDEPRAAPGWTELFNPNYPDGVGWLAADGIYSIPVDEERYAQYPDAETLFWFSDTIVGELEDGEQRGTDWVTNSVAVLEPFDEGEPRSDRLHFHYATDEAGEPEPMFDPPDPDTWYWPKDGFVDPSDGNWYLFVARMTSSDGGLGFAIDGVDLLRIDRTDIEAFVEDVAAGDANGTSIASERFEMASLFQSTDDDEKQIADAVLVNTAEAGAPDPDGYVYAYGLDVGDGNKGLLVARVPPGGATDGDAWRFWDGSAWREELAAAEPIADRASDEMSVTPLSDGRYLHVFQLDTISEEVSIATADRPEGPFTDRRTVYTAPEPDEFAADGNDTVYAYNAKAYPHLSPDEGLLVSYNVNAFENGLDGSDRSYSRYVSEIYKPRFVYAPASRI